MKNTCEMMVDSAKTLCPNYEVSEFVDYFILTCIIFEGILDGCRPLPTDSTEGLWVSAYVQQWTSCASLPYFQNEVHNKKVKFIQTSTLPKVSVSSRTQNVIPVARTPNESN